MSTRNPQYIGLRKSLLALSTLLGLLAVAPVTAHLQGTPFNSGSTGADGVFAPSANIVVQLPESGVFNYTTVNIPANVTVRFRKNARNTPVTILATGDVAINGIIDISGSASNGIAGGEGGPGGFRGGDGGTGIELDLRAGKPGEGPGGGGGGKLDNWYGGGGGFAIAGGNSSGANQERGGFGGPRYGSRTLLPLIGGSGGGGEAAGNSRPGAGGGGGGGAILIASSGSIIFGNGSAIRTNGGGSLFNGGAGAGGAVRLIANTISGRPSIEIRGANSGGGGHGSYGYARAEAFDYNNFFPSASNPNYSLARPNPVTLPNAPQLRITSVGGVNAPATPAGSFAAAPDIVVPTSVANPVQVAIQANNVPVNTVVQLTLTAEIGDRTNVQSTPLAGTPGSSTATASVTLPTTGVSVLTATVSVEGLLAFGGRPVFIDGERVDRVEVAATFGQAARVTYITQAGRRVRWPE